MEEIISIKNLNKTFKEVKAVNNLSFKVKKGEFFAFLGINGAGKSTTISIMCGELTRDSGEVYIDGKNIDEQSRTAMPNVPRFALLYISQTNMAFRFMLICSPRHIGNGKRCSMDIFQTCMT